MVTSLVRLLSHSSFGTVELVIIDTGEQRIRVTAPSIQVLLKVDELFKLNQVLGQAERDLLKWGN